MCAFYLARVKRHLAVQLLFCTALVAVSTPAFFGGCGTGNTTTTEPTALTDTTANTYIGPEACGACHAKEYADWTQSHHKRAMMPASDSTVLGDFDQASFTADGVTSTFFRRDGKFIIRTEGHDGVLEDFEVKYTFGFTPLQQYLVEAPGGRMQVPRVSWDVKAGKWFHQYPGQRIPAHDWLHWTGAAQNWNAMCASCHSTDLQRHYNEDNDSYHTTYANLTVTCESCHGPGAKHAQYAAGEAYRNGARVEGAHLLLHKGLDNVALMSTCARCHARRSEIGDAPMASLELLDNYIPSLPAPDLYHADGQMRDEVYVHGSFAQSKMFRRGVKCTDCHQPHTGRLLFDGNALCGQCHAPSTYDSEGHSHHRAGAEAPTCVSCHMPTHTYMGNDVRHDHSFRVPRPDQSVRYGTPNTCTQCHTERNDQWAADVVVGWYGPQRQPHFSDRLLAGAQADEVSLQALLELLVDTASPAIIRATALHHLEALPHERSLEAMLRGLKDPDAQVRHQAIIGLSAYPPDRWVGAVSPLLGDRVRAVRIEAARALSGAPEELFDRARTPAFTTADKELMAMLHYQSDMTTGALMLADQALRAGDAATAERQYLHALHMDSLANYARLNLASLYNANGRNAEALVMLQQALAIDPGNPRIPYNLALLYAELQRPSEALAAFERTEELGAESDRVYVNHSALLQQQGNIERAKVVLDAGLIRFPRSADLLAETTGLLLREGRMREATGYLERLRALAPNDPRVAELDGFLQQLVKGAR